jgi:hypothetical protein
VSGLSPLHAAVLSSLLFGMAEHGPSLAQTAALTPPSSLTPSDKTVAVQLTHRHRAVRECVAPAGTKTCAGRELEADTATTVRFERVEVAKAKLIADRGMLQVTFPPHVGPQEQTIRLEVGDWLVDWPGAAGIGHLHVVAGAKPRVTLVTSSGRCRFKEQRCELDTARRRQLTVRDDVEQ